MNIGASFLDTVGKILDYVPFVSTGKGIVKLVQQVYQKIIGKVAMEEPFPIGEHKWSLERILVRREGNTSRNITVCVPVIGNIAVGIVDVKNYLKIKNLIGKPDGHGRLRAKEDDLKKAVELGSGRAAVELATRVMIRLAFRPNDIDLKKEIYEWSKKGAELGDAQAKTLLGLCYCNGIGIQEDTLQAFKLWKESADRGETQAMMYMGLCFEKGIGVDHLDYKMAFDWYEKSAKGGNLVGMVRVGDCYSDGIGVDPNDDKAFEWCKKSADQGNTEGMRYVANFYEVGIGREKNLDKARELYEKAAALGDEEAGSWIMSHPQIKEHNENASTV
jgi:hypothetical protein